MMEQLKEKLKEAGVNFTEKDGVLTVRGHEIEVAAGNDQLMGFFRENKGRYLHTGYSALSALDDVQIAKSAWRIQKIDQE